MDGATAAKAAILCGSHCVQQTKNACRLLHLAIYPCCVASQSCTVANCGTKSGIALYHWWFSSIPKLRERCCVANGKPSFFPAHTLQERRCACECVARLLDLQIKCFSARMCAGAPSERQQRFPPHACAGARPSQKVSFALVAPVVPQ